MSNTDSDRAQRRRPVYRPKLQGREKRHVEQINDEISKSIIEDTAAATLLVRSIASLIAEWFFKDSNR